MQQRQRHNRNRFTLLLAWVAICALMLAACSSGKGTPAANESAGQSPASSAPPESAKPAADGKKWVIRFDPQMHLPKKPDAKDPTEKRALDDLNKEYEALHPNVKIELVKVPTTQDRNAWLQARMMAKDAPDIFWAQFESTWDHYQKGWFYAVDDWLKQPNPYNGNKIWGDTFVPGVLDSVRAPDGKLYDIPSDGVGVAIYYNKTIFKELGLNVPKTWQEFMNVQAKIKESGKTPFAFMHVDKGCCDLSWTDSLMNSQFMRSDLAKYDTDHNNRVDTPEIAQAVKNGTLPELEVLRQQLILYKEWSQYWPKGFLSKYDQSEMFSSGKAAMQYGGSWSITALKTMNLPFEWGVFNFPVITKESASLASGKGSKVLGAWGPGQWVIPGYMKQEEPEKLAVIMDYLMFLSTPEHNTIISKETESEPYIVGAEASSGHEVFIEDLPLTVIQGYDVYLGKTYSDMWENAVIKYLSGAQDIETTLSDLQKAYKKGAEEMLAGQ
ncbi:ABC transporter substrate-binding protein [Paenibacillus contaminans]|uniref:ABC transporter substrate-binding protein n=1 Tax=Paenibacillus contaminans TaxID=450362 RepID=A0A329MIM9_9BACL|nr:extracellular solute-binding protein [Paenibacillus contaminans]RAV19665.1 hypothetical protein DQG23_19590 [Paenibacillus contaminans]